jgi:hypothetical protein
MSQTAQFIDSVETDDGRYDVWSTDGTLDGALYVSEFAEDNLRPVEDDELEAFIRDELA